MSHFYASIPRSARKTTPTACGHKNTGLAVDAASWQGRILVQLHNNNEDGKDYFCVTQETHYGAGCHEIIASGVLGEPTGNSDED